MANNKRADTKRMVLGAVFTALVIVFQLMATFTAFFGPFSTAIGLIPIAIGAMLCGPIVGAWLGLVFGVVVLASGGANLFLAFDFWGTIITVLAKGVLCGLCSGLVYKLFKKVNDLFAAVVSAVVCPVVNTSVFLIGCAVFMLDNVSDIAQAAESPETGMAVFFGFAVANFVFEVGMNLVLSPIMIRILNIRKNL